MFFLLLCGYWLNVVSSNVTQDYKVFGWDGELVCEKCFSSPLWATWSVQMYTCDQWKKTEKSIWYFDNWQVLRWLRFYRTLPDFFPHYVKLFSLQVPFKMQSSFLLLVSWSNLYPSLSVLQQLHIDGGSMYSYLYYILL